MKKLLLSLIVFLVSFEMVAQDTPCSAEVMYLNTTCGATATFNEFYTNLEGTSPYNASCTSDNETTQEVTWVSFTATATSMTVTNNTNYVGPGAGEIEDKDFVLYTGACGSLTQFACAADVDGSGGTTTFTGLTVGTTYYMATSHSASSLAEGCTTCDVASICLTSTVSATQPAAACNTCSSPCTLTTNVTSSGTNISSTADAFICSGSVENNVWYQWCAPSTWPVGQSAYISVFDQFCGTSSGLQLTVWNFGGCPTAATNSNVVCANPGITTSYYYTWTAVASQCYLIAIDGFGGTVCTWSITVGSIIVLPTELSNFNVYKQNNIAQLTWETQSETNNDYFTIERSNDGVNFDFLDKVEGAGTINYSKSYSVNDLKPHKGMNYYRLSQTDYDGNKTIHPVKSVYFDDNQNNFTIYPNPNQNDFTIQYDGEDNELVTISIYDLTGKMIEKIAFNVIENQNTYPLTTNLAKGTYLISLTNGNKTDNQKLVIK